MKAPSHLVSYRDSPDAQTLMFGPFVSESVADFFIAALPEPLKGGYVGVVPLQPFLAHEARTVASIIHRNREANPVKARQLVS